MTPPSKMFPDDFDSDGRRHIVCALHGPMQDAIKDIREGQQQILAALGIATSEIADLRRADSEHSQAIAALTAATWRTERSRSRLSVVPDTDEVESLRSQLDEVKAALAEERRRTHSDFRELQRMGLERWKLIVIVLGLLLTGGGAGKLLELILKGLGH